MDLSHPHQSLWSCNSDKLRCLCRCKENLITVCNLLLLFWFCRGAFKVCVTMTLVLNRQEYDLLLPFRRLGYCLRQHFIFLQNPYLPIKTNQLGHYFISLNEKKIGKKGLESDLVREIHQKSHLNSFGIVWLSPLMLSRINSFFLSANSHRL